MLKDQTIIGQLRCAALSATRASAPICANFYFSTILRMSTMSSYIDAELRCSMLHKHYFYSEVYNHTALTSYGFKQSCKNAGILPATRRAFTFFCVSWWLQWFEIAHLLQAMSKSVLHYHQISYQTIQHGEEHYWQTHIRITNELFNTNKTTF